MSMPKCYKKESKPSNFCPGCGHSLTLKNLGYVIDDLKIAKNTVFSLDIGCSLLAWDFFDIDTIQGHHGRAIPMATGVKRAMPKTSVIAYMGDGGGYAIGLHHLMHAAKRNEPLTVILVNNTLFAMTGGQKAPTTIKKEVTESTPNGAFTDDEPFFGPEVLRAVVSKKAFLARGSTNNLFQLQTLIKRAIENTKKGNFSFVEVLSFCPINWKTSAKGSIEFLEKLERVYKLGVISDES